MTEGILTITLSKRMTFLRREAVKETKRVAMKNQGKVIAFPPKPVFMISQSNDARFHTKRVEILILFDCEDTQGGMVRGAPFLRKAGYSPRAIFRNVPMLSMPRFSSK